MDFKLILENHERAISPCFSGGSSNCTCISYFIMATFEQMLILKSAVLDKKLFSLIKVNKHHLPTNYKQSKTLGKEGMTCQGPVLSG